MVRAVDVLLLIWSKQVVMYAKANGSTLWRILHPDVKVKGAATAQPVQPHQSMRICQRICQKLCLLLGGEVLLNSMVQMKVYMFTLIKMNRRSTPGVSGSHIERIHRYEEVKLFEIPTVVVHN